jgi:hypothetical protein
MAKHNAHHLKHLEDSIKWLQEAVDTGYERGQGRLIGHAEES